jgi:hypothetical protein
MDVQNTDHSKTNSIVVVFQVVAKYFFFAAIGFPSA